MNDPIKDRDGKVMVCDGQIFLGFTVKACDRPATHHVYADEYEQYWFCDRHYYFDQHGYYPEDDPTRGTIDGVSR